MNKKLDWIRQDRKSKNKIDVYHIYQMKSHIKARQLLNESSVQQTR